MGPSVMKSKQVSPAGEGGVSQGQQECELCALGSLPDSGRAVCLLLPRKEGRVRLGQVPEARGQARTLMSLLTRNPSGVKCAVQR